MTVKQQDRRYWAFETCTQGFRQAHNDTRARKENRLQNTAGGCITWTNPTLKNPLIRVYET